MWWSEKVEECWSSSHFLQLSTLPRILQGHLTLLPAPALPVLLSMRGATCILSIKIWAVSSTSLIYQYLLLRLTLQSPLRPFLNIAGCASHDFRWLWLSGIWSGVSMTQQQKPLAQTFWCSGLLFACLLVLSSPTLEKNRRPQITLISGRVAGGEGWMQSPYSAGQHLVLWLLGHIRRLSHPLLLQSVQQVSKCFHVSTDSAATSNLFFKASQVIPFSS